MDIIVFAFFFERYLTIDQPSPVSPPITIYALSRLMSNSSVVLISRCFVISVMFSTSNSPKYSNSWFLFKKEI